MTEFDLSEHVHRRFNPLKGEWVLVSPHRAKRPWQGQVEKPEVTASVAYEPDCYLCPGNTRAGGVRNPDYSDVFVFDNDFAALRPDTPEGHKMTQACSWQRQRQALRESSASLRVTT